MRSCGATGTDWYSSPYVILAHYGELEWVSGIIFDLCIDADILRLPSLESKPI